MGCLWDAIGAPVGLPSGPLGGHFGGPGLPLGLFWSALVSFRRYLVAFCVEFGLSWKFGGVSFGDLF